MRPAIGVKEAARVMRVSEPTANKLLSLLASHGHLREITGRAWGRAYVAPAILDAVDRTPA